MEQIRRIMRPTDVPDQGTHTHTHTHTHTLMFHTSSSSSSSSSSQGLLCDLLWSDPDKETMRWGENDRGVSFTFGPEIVSSFLAKHDLDLICRAHQVCVCVCVCFHIPTVVIHGDNPIGDNPQLESDDHYRCTSPHTLHLMSDPLPIRWWRMAMSSLPSVSW